MPPVLAFSGYSNSGKTTLVTGLVAELTRRGRSIGVVKHHGHRDARTQKKDSDRHLEAGATAAALTGPSGAAVYLPQTGDPYPLAAAAVFERVDLVIAEGFKTWPGFKIEVVAREAEPSLIDDPLLLALALGEDRLSPPNIRRLDRSDIAATADFVEACFLPPDRRGPVPDREKCFALIGRYEMLPNIVAHSLVVHETARRLAAAIVRNGHNIDLPLVEAGALLHDIAKSEGLRTKQYHSIRGREIVASLGYSETAEVVFDHISPIEARRKRGLFSPSLVVNYADKRVRHAQVVSLDQRFEYLLNQYGRTDEGHARISAMYDGSKEVEAELFARLDMNPDDLLSVNDSFVNPR